MLQGLGAWCRFYLWGAITTRSSFQPPCVVIRYYFLFFNFFHHSPTPNNTHLLHGSHTGAAPGLTFCPQMPGHTRPPCSSSPCLAFNLEEQKCTGWGGIKTEVRAPITESPSSELHTLPLGFTTAPALIRVYVRIIWITGQRAVSYSSLLFPAPSQ